MRDLFYINFTDIKGLIEAVILPVEIFGSGILPESILQLRLQCQIDLVSYPREQTECSNR